MKHFSGRVVQIAAGCTPGDAITNEVEIIHRYLSQHDYKSAVFAENIAPGLTFRASTMRMYTPRPDDVIILHHSISMRYSTSIAQLPNRKIMIYHNVTPPDFFVPYNYMLAERVRRARRELPRFMQYFDSCFADSTFNAEDLAGHPHVRVMPVLFPALMTERGSLSPTGKLRNTAEQPQILFVGRIVPNKGYADLLKIFYFMRREIPGARLTLAGSFFPGLETYDEELRALIRSLSLENHVRFTGFVSDEVLTQLYASADLYLCASHHEGFCVPLLEAMAAGVPVAAYTGGRSAVGETMDGAGITFSQMDHPLAAALAVSAVRDESLRKAIVETQVRRLELFRPDVILSMLVSEVERLAAVRSGGD
ncbi:MAG: glycosyltransferase [Spirochaetia bacterium]|nr:glycosyltransferase [Spirochaetia bacterium]